jgi:EmrB/QacA subfamily drug resistance transporter
MQRKWWTLLAVSVATFMLLLDITVVNVALPSIRKDLGASFTDLQWVVDAYAVTLAALVLPAGSLADRLGRRRLFTVGLAVFSVASLLCALAPDPTLLSLARALQGVGGAVLFAVSLALVAQEFPAGRQRATAMGLYGATIGVAVAIGPLVGGALTDGLGWASVFYLNVPVGMAALTVTQLKLRESRDPNATGVDWAGAATFSGALLLLVLALVRGNAEGWGSSLIVSLLAGSTVLLVAFIAIERRVRQPMLPLGLFKRPSFTGVQLAAFTMSGSLLAMFLYLTLYLQNYLGYAPLAAGLRYLPITLLALLVGPIAGALLSRVPARELLSAGLAMTGVGLLLMSGIKPGSGWTTLLGGFLVAGAGVGLLNPVIANLAVSVVPNQHSGMAAGINDTFRQVGIAVGIAVWSDPGRPRRRQGRRADGRDAHRQRPPPTRARRGRLVGQPGSGPRRGPPAGPAGRLQRGRRGLPRRAQRRADPRRAAQLRRRSPGPVAGSRARDPAPADGAGARAPVRCPAGGCRRLRIKDDGSAGTGFHRHHEAVVPHDPARICLFHTSGVTPINRTLRQNAGALRAALAVADLPAERREVLLLSCVGFGWYEWRAIGLRNVRGAGRVDARLPMRVWVGC